MKEIKGVLPKALTIFLVSTLVCGIFYTGIVTGLAQLLFPEKANGSIIEVNGKKYGCEPVGTAIYRCCPYVGPDYEY